MRIGKTGRTGEGSGNPEPNPILGTDEAIATITKAINRKGSSYIRNLQLHTVERIILKFEVGSKVRIVTNTSSSTVYQKRSEDTGTVVGYKLDTNNRIWKLVLDKDKDRERKDFTIDPKGYCAVALRPTDKGIELLNSQDDDNIKLSIERV